MRTFAIAIVATLLASPPALAKSPGCIPTPDGGSICREADGHITERHPDKDGVMRTTSTDRRRWGTADGHGGGITPPDGMVRNDPLLRREVWGRVTEPWEPTAKPAPTPGGWRTPGPADRTGR